MNERIRELADEAAKFSAVMALSTGESGDELFVERFAELIVRECADLSFEHWAVTHDTSPQEAILKHFGVEE
jgi:hypothetical protein